MRATRTTRARRPRWIKTIAAVAVAGLVLAACGDGDDEVADEPDPTDDAADDAADDEDEANDADESDDSAASDEDWPDDTIRLLVGSSEGGGLDTAARLMQGPMAERLGQDVVVENHPGAQLSISQTIVQNEGDACDVLDFTNFPIILFATYVNDLDWGFEDYYPIAAVQNQPSVVVVPGDSDIQTMDDLIALAEANPGEVTASVSAITSTNAVGIMEMEEAFGIDVNIIDYDGGSPARQAVLSGEVDFSHTSVFAALPLLIGGELRVLAAHQTAEDWENFTSVDELSDVPTLEEATGVALGSNTATYGIVVSRTCYETYPDRYETLVEAANGVLQSPEFVAQLEELNLELSLLDLTPDEYYESLVRQQESVDNLAPELFG